MDLVVPVLIGIGLSMDCFAVSLAIGTTSKAKLVNVALIIALCFGMFQTGMTLLGWAAGTHFAELIADYDHWVAFLLLAVIGIKMVIEGWRKEDEQAPVDVIQLVPVIVLSVATSIDALAVGVSFAFLQLEILVPALIIGIVAFVCSFAGVLSGTRLASVVGNRVEIIGGLILLTIGLKILLEHVFTG
jgi:manganese efflux pump family protein